MAILDEHTLEFISRSPEQTRRLGIRLGELLRGRELICLEGELGTGKTCLTQGVAAGWGATGPVQSPTFTIIREYHRPGDRQKFHHVDLYRISGPAEAWALGLDDVWTSSDVCIIEWAERAQDILPGERLWIRLTALDETRRMLRMAADGKCYHTLLREFRRATFGG